MMIWLDQSKLENQLNFWPIHQEEDEMLAYHRSMGNSISPWDWNRLEGLFLVVLDEGDYDEQKITEVWEN